MKEVKYLIIPPLSSNLFHFIVNIYDVLSTLMDQKDGGKYGIQGRVGLIEFHSGWYIYTQVLTSHNERCILTWTNLFRIGTGLYQLSSASDTIITQYL